MEPYAHLSGCRTRPRLRLRLRGGDGNATTKKYAWESSPTTPEKARHNSPKLKNERPHTNFCSVELAPPLPRAFEIISSVILSAAACFETPTCKDPKSSAAACCSCRLLHAKKTTDKTKPHGSSGGLQMQKGGVAGIMLGPGSLAGRPTCVVPGSLCCDQGATRLHVYWGCWAHKEY